MSKEIPYLDKYFPTMSSNQLNKIQYDEEGIYSITPPSSASIISKSIKNHLDEEKISILDAFGGLGGNTFSFSENFSCVITSELDNERFLMLANNVATLGCRNVTLYNGNYKELINSMFYDVIFMDPPWGGKDYKKNKKMTFTIDDVLLSDICTSIVEEKRCSFLVLKLPLNYDLDSFPNKIREKWTVDKMKKIIVLYIDCRN